MSLDDTFGLDREKLIDGDIGVHIPESEDERDLNLVIGLALKAYSDMMNDLSFMEPKNRLKGYEVAERYLNQAKDARAKLDKLTLDREKMKMEKGSRGSQKATGEEKEEDKGSGEGVSRKELVERMRLEKVK